jgi:hypothetical protein
MSVDKTWRRRKPALKALFPWPGFFLLDQNLPDYLLGFQAEGFCPLQIAGQGPGPHAMLQPFWKGVVDPLSSIQVGPEQNDNDQGAKGNVREHIRRSRAHGVPTTEAKPAMLPDPNRCQCKLPHGLHPSPVPAMSVKRPRAAEALVAYAGPLLSTAIGSLMPEEQIRSEYQPIPKTRYQTHVAATLSQVPIPVLIQQIRES